MSMTTINMKRLRSRTLLAACIVLLAFAFAACSSSSGGGGGSSGAADITIKNLKFSAASVKSGAKVTVKNNDSLTHTVTSDDGTSFNVTVNSGGTATFPAPSTAGSYKFHCNIHSSMHGTLTVT